MIGNPKLKSLSVDYGEFLEEHFSEKEFQKFLREHPKIFSSIRSIYEVIYIIDEQECKYGIKPISNDNWEVYKLNKKQYTYFTFSCTEEKEFIATFVKELKNKIDPDDSYPDAKVSMGF